MNHAILAYMCHFRKLYAQMFQEAGERYGLSKLEMDILLFLHNNPGYNTARDITVMRGFAKSNVSRAVELLRSRGYLSAEAERENRKLRRLALTESVRGIVEELAGCQEAFFGILMCGFTPDERAALEDFFRRTDENMTRALEEEDYDL